ncbi:MAG TPA: hypothetical protein VKA34_08080 [Balneolales bacterium]|nr:hypothetical protein [Balneolales bacterium]
MENGEWKPDRRKNHQTDGYLPYNTLQNCHSGRNKRGYRKDMAIKTKKERNKAEYRKNVPLGTQYR